MAKTKPKKIAEIMATSCIAARVRLINRVVTGIFDQALRPLDLKVSQGNIMAVIALKGGTRPKDVCSLLHLEKSTFSRNVARMRAKGWLKIGSEEGTIYLTEKGGDLLVKAFPAWQEAQNKVESILGKKGMKSVLSLADGPRLKRSD